MNRAHEARQRMPSLHIEPWGPPTEQLPNGELRSGMGLCLSGGGYRAMLFHLGSLWRLNESGYLSRLECVSSVSGGSIAAGVLAHRWHRLNFDSAGVATNFADEIVVPLRKLARQRIDLPAILLGTLLPGSIGNRVARSYRHVFGDVSLQELPDRPRFVFNATSLQSGELVRLSKPYLWDWRVGAIQKPDLALALVVAASSAFPPFLSPVVLPVASDDFVPESGQDLAIDPFRKRVVVIDGGVYDNLGLDAVWQIYRHVLISDGGGRTQPQQRPSRRWAFQAYRTLSLIDRQVRSLRKRQVIAAYRDGAREGAYWGINTDISDYGLNDALPCPFEKTLALAAVPTRLTKLAEDVQERLVNWGFAVCDAALRRHIDSRLTMPVNFPYPGASVG
jgi:NTE family protein